MTTPTLYLPGATFHPVSYRHEAGHFTSQPLGWILHVVVGNGSPFRTFEGARPPRRRFSHGWVAKDGSAEQYTTLDMKSWAQAGGNGLYWSFETEGYPDEPLTPAQIRRLAQWHDFLGVPDVLALQPGQRGIGTHYMGGAAWGGHSCPDQVGHEGKGPRSHQRADILATAQAFRARAGDGTSRDQPRPRPPAARFAVGRVLRYRGRLRPLMKGEDVKHVQRAVGLTGDAVDGKYGPGTRDAVRAAQRRLHIPDDGVVGRQTVEALGGRWLG